jgi:uncharacterized protein
MAAMRIWVDADACPKVIKDILYRAAERTGIELTLVSNQALRIPPSRVIRAIQVPRGFDVADERIADALAAGDLVITADIPLAAAVVGKGAIALDPRGDVYTDANIRERLAMRNLMEALRSSGEAVGGPAPLGNRERQQFAAALDRLLAQPCSARQSR